MSHPTTAGGRHYRGESVDGFGNELFITTHTPGEPDKRLKKSISRSTIDLALDTVIEAQKMGKVISGPRSLGIPGAGSYVFSILVIMKN